MVLKIETKDKKRIEYPDHALLSLQQWADALGIGGPTVQRAFENAGIDWDLSFPMSCRAERIVELVRHLKESHKLDGKLIHPWLQGVSDESLSQGKFGFRSKSRNKVSFEKGKPPSNYK